MRIGYLGQFGDHKGVHVLMRAFKRLNQTNRKCKLFLYGKLTNESVYGRKLLGEIEGQDNITYQGRYDNQQVGDVLNDLDLIVVPSVWFENRPTIIVEALAMKTPVIASKIGGIVELIDDGINGLLCEPGNVDDLASKLQRVVDDPTLLPKLRDGIQPIMRTEDEIDKLLDLYSSLIKQPA